MLSSTGGLKVGVSLSLSLAILASTELLDDITKPTISTGLLETVFAGVSLSFLNCCNDNADQPLFLSTSAVSIQISYNWLPPIVACLSRVFLHTTSNISAEVNVP